ncbi:DNA-directed RNA polymerase [Bertholletia excelsa]
MRVKVQSGLLSIPKPSPRPHCAAAQLLPASLCPFASHFAGASSSPIAIAGHSVFASSDHEKKATKDLGYFLAVTTVDNIEEGRVREQTGDVLFPVLFSCVTFKIYRGEILEGVVHKVLKHGVFLRCGPIENIYLSNQKMPDYRYVPGENPFFMSDKFPKIDKDVVVRFIVIGTKYIETDKEFQAVVSLEGDYLGPIS